MTTPALTTQLLGIPHAKLHPAPDNLRGTLTDVESLAQSIAEAGLLQPLRVTPHPDKAGQWMIIAGHRRHAAIGRLIESGRWRKTQPIACVHDGADVDDPTRVQAMLIENLQRVDLDPIEEAKGYERLATEFSMSVRDIADKVGRSKSVVSARTQLLKLPDVVQRRVSEGTVPLELATKLTRLPDQVAEKLTKSGGLNDWQVNDAIRSHERAEFTRAATAAAKALGIAVAKGYSWELHGKGYTEVHAGITASALGKVLLSATPDEYLVTLNPYDKTCTVWQAPSAKFHPDTTTEADPLATARNHWQEEYSKREQTLEADRAQWRQRRNNLIVELARAATAADVTESALQYLVAVAGDVGDLTDLGAPPVEDDGSDALDEWLKDRRNLIAVAAYAMIRDHSFTSPLGTQASIRLDAEVGPQPPHPQTLLGWQAPQSIEAALQFYAAIGGHDAEVAALRAALSNQPGATDVAGDLDEADDA